MIFTAKLVQMSAMCKKKTDFLFAYSRVQPNLSKISANECNVQGGARVLLTAYSALSFFVVNNFQM